MFREALALATTALARSALRSALTALGIVIGVASVVAMEFPESLAGSLKQSSLFALGFLLFVISFVVLATSRWLLRSRLK